MASAETAAHCPATGQDIPYSLRIGITDGSQYPIDPIPLPAFGARYDNQQKHSRRLIANKWVTGFELQFSDQLEFEANFDWFDIAGPCVGSCTLQHRLTGSIATPATRAVSYTPSGNSLQSSPPKLSFLSDYSITKAGANITNVKVICDGSPNDLPASLGTFESVDGLLLGPDDVVYMSFPAGAPSDQHHSLTLEVPPGTPGDFDIYARCGSRPTVSIADFVGVSTKSHESLHWAETARPCSSSWNVMVHSYNNGSAANGQFRLFYARHKAAQHFDYTVGYRPGPGSDVAADKAMIPQYLKAQSRDIFAATDGQVWVDWKIWTLPVSSTKSCWDGTWTCEGGAQCNVCLLNPEANPVLQTRGTSSGAPSEQIAVASGAWRNWASLLHEFGHAHLGLGVHNLPPSGSDGYFGVGDANYSIGLPSSFPTTRRDLLFNSCGHSTMSNGFLSPTAHKFCTSHNHMFDMRYVDGNDELSVLTSNGVFSKSLSAASTGYETPFSIQCLHNCGAFGDGFVFPDDTNPRLHSTFWSGMSDYAIGVFRGILIYEPTGSDDPASYLSFAPVETFKGHVNQFVGSTTFAP